MNYKFLFLFGLVILLFYSFNIHQSASVQNKVYNFNKPDKIISLPDELYEVSGLTDFSDNQIACVQDERGIIFIFDILKSEIVSTFEFGDDNDYEGLTRVDNTLYALESTGNLFEISFEKKKSKKNKTYDLNLPSIDNEGLCFDEKYNQLLVVPKSKLGKGPEYKNLRAVFQFNLKQKTLTDEPLFYFSSDDIFKFASERNKLDKSTYTASGKNKFQFRPSSIAVEPKTDHIYIISAEDFGLTVFDRLGNILDYVALDKTLYPKPEGITFFKSGDMVITSEGDTQSSAKLILIKQN